VFAGDEAEMNPYYSDEAVTILNGNCLAVMPEFPSEFIDSVVTDPPYELGFMGKSWDRSGIAYNVEVWRECLRVLKPGGHLLAFGGSRTYHRLACAIEDAGFEIRDQIQWIYGSGFPKSLDVSKAIDQAGGLSPREQSDLLRNKRERARFTREALAQKVGCTVSSVRDWEEGRARAVGRAIEYIIPSPEYRAKLADVLGYTADERVIVGAGNGSRSLYETGHRGIAYGAATTDSAKQWDGWGTALKPAHEPLVLARKPLIGTVAENVLQHGTGGLNVDGCRIEIESTDDIYAKNPHTLGTIGANGIYGDGKPTLYEQGKGRWPANVITDGSDEVLAGFPDSESRPHAGAQLSGNGTHGGWKREAHKKEYPKWSPHCDSGSAARFFYCAKASKADRNEGLGEARNQHPTVKPASLMRYLVRLITPPNGTVLDPFAGSGSTGKACAFEGMKAILIEKEIEYCELAMMRTRRSQEALKFEAVA